MYLYLAFEGTDVTPDIYTQLKAGRKGISKCTRDDGTGRERIGKERNGWRRLWNLNFLFLHRCLVLDSLMVFPSM